MSVHPVDVDADTTGAQDSAGATSDGDAMIRWRPPRLTRDFTAGLAAITGSALIIRWAFTYFGRRGQPLGTLTDNRWYYEAGQMLASGVGFGNPLIWFQDQRYVPTAGHPPVYPLFLGLTAFLGVDTPVGARLATCVLGAITVAVIGLTARDLAGNRAGLIAAGLAAIYPNLWINDSALVSETPYAMFIALFLFAAYRCWRDPTVGRVALLSVWIALATLTRSEALLLYPLCVLPMMLRLRGFSWSLRWKRLGLAALVAAVLIGPWVAYNNQPGRFENRVFIVGGSGIAMSYGNCAAAYTGTYLGYWAWECGVGEVQGSEDETVIDAAARDQATRYVRSHLRQQPKVIAARIGRLFHVYRPSQSIGFDHLLERRGLWPSRLALAMYYPVTLLAIIGGVLVWRRKQLILPYLAVTAVVAVSAALTFGITRYRIAFDVAAVVLAGVALDTAIGWISRRASPETASSDAVGAAS
ncbi:MAG TPA: glycosyltransferase family 39 protein [Acidimicrobiia bacterium]|nr:glycosyltransferase family 39 protein [Acidimicrobiia bacterium]